MFSTVKTKILFIVFICTLPFNSSLSNAEPQEQDVLDAMRKASEFMVDTVSCNGGFVYQYLPDLSYRWGEAPARPSQIWVQGSTPDTGEMFLNVYTITGDAYYLKCAKKAANALIYGQHPLGGWHYFIDFDKPGLDKWYKEVFSQFKWGMEEYRHYYGNCTYDDNTTQGATRFLLRLYMTTLDPVYREPLLKALDFILMSQYPNGGWPQRYPLRYEFVHDGLADYTSYYTMNDNSMRDIIDVLVEAWEKLGNEAYLKAALRGMDFMILAQGPEEQAGWAEQYDVNLKPAWARTHEPSGYMPRQSEQCINQLMDFYLMTGDRRYLKPIPPANRWMERSSFKDLGNGRFELARYYEAGTNKPVFQIKTGRVNEEGYGLYEYTDNPDKVVAGGWTFTTVDIGRMERRYDRISALTPGEAIAEYKALKDRKPAAQDVDPKEVQELLNSMDKRGAWLYEVKVYDMSITMESEDPRVPRKVISTPHFITNMNILARYIGYVRSKD